MFSRKSKPFSRFSLRARLIGLFVLIFGAVLVLYSVVLYKVTHDTNERELDAALFNYAVDVAYTIDVSFFGDIRISPNALAEREKVFPFSVGNTYMQLLDMDGGVIARSRSIGRASLPFSKQDLRKLSKKPAIFRTIEMAALRRLGAGDTYRLITYLVQQPGLPPLVLQIAAPLLIQEKMERGLLSFFLISIPLVLLVASFGGLYVSRRALAPVNEIIRKARAITARDLSERVPVPPSEDEIRQLALTLNDLLNRLESAFKSQEVFIADASHQLRTPLAILRGELDVMRSQPRSPEEITQFFESAVQEVGYLTRIVEDLLLLARVEAGPDSLSLEPLRLDEILLEVVSRFESLGKSKDIRITVNLSDPDAGSGERAFSIPGDSDLIRSLFESILENAIKYSMPGTRVMVGIEDREESVITRITDSGPGIPAEAVPKLFERFYRVPRSERHASGSGLGLAIARRIARIHRGDISVESRVGEGSTFSVHLNK